jgi:hypothetical protein
MQEKLVYQLNVFLDAGCAEFLIRKKRLKIKIEFYKTLVALSFFQYLFN